MITLSKFSNGSDITVGIPIDIRPDSKFDSAIGNFVNVLPVRSCIDLEMQLMSFIASCHENFYNDCEFRHIPFRMIIKELGLLPEVNKNPIFQTMLTYQDYENILPNLKELTVDYFNPDYKASRLDLTFEIFHNIQ